MANRNSFIDFVRGLLTINPLERWSPQQAKLHPFITQQKYTGPFVPPMNLKSASINKTPAPGIQQQQQAEAQSKQRAQQQQAQQQQAAQIQAQNAMVAASAAMQMNQYPPSPHVQSPTGMYNMYTGQAAPPPYPVQTGYGQPMGMMQPTAAQMHYAQPPTLHQQVAARTGRPRASTNNESAGGGIPPALQRVVSHLDPNAPIRLAPSPAYYPPPPDGAPDSRRRASRAGAPGQPRGNRDFIRTLEDRSIEEGYMNANQGWQ